MMRRSSRVFMGGVLRPQEHTLCATDPNGIRTLAATPDSY